MVVVVVAKSNQRPDETRRDEMTEIRRSIVQQLAYLLTQPRTDWRVNTALRPRHHHQYIHESTAAAQDVHSTQYFIPRGRSGCRCWAELPDAVC